MFLGIFGFQPCYLSLQLALASPVYDIRDGRTRAMSGRDKQPKSGILQKSSRQTYERKAYPERQGMRRSALPETSNIHDLSCFSVFSDI